MGYLIACLFSVLCLLLFYLVSMVSNMNKNIRYEYNNYIEKRVSNIGANYKFEHEKIFNLKLKEWISDNEFEIRRKAIGQSQFLLDQKLTKELKLINENFSFNPKDIKYVGRFIDLIIFDGSASNSEVSIYFIEIVTQKGKKQNKFKYQVDNAITNKRYSFKEIYL